MMIYLVIFVIAILLIYLVYDYFITSREDQIRERLYAGVLDTEENDVSVWSDAADLLKVDKFKNLIEKSVLTRNFDLKIKQSGLKLGLMQGMIIMAASAVVGVVAIYLYVNDKIYAIAGLFAFPMLLSALLSVYVNRRLKKHDEQMPALIASLITTMGAGGTPMHALMAASKNSPSPVRESMATLVHSLQIGRTPNEAWKEWADFWGTKSCKLISTGVRLKWETGGQMTTILQHILETLEFHKRMELRVSTLTAQAKLSAWVLSALPAGLALLTNAYRPDLFDAMLSDPLGVKLLISAGVMSLLGFIWLRKIAQLKS